MMSVNTRVQFNQPCSNLRRRLCDCNLCNLIRTSPRKHKFVYLRATTLFAQNGTGMVAITQACMAPEGLIFTAEIFITVDWFLTACVVSTMDCYPRLAPHSCH